MMLTVSNGRNFGGAFKIAPQASVCDGMLDVHTFFDAKPARRLNIFMATIRGRHAALPEVSFETHSAIRLDFDAPPKMEIDGELRAARAASVLLECIPGALSVVAAPGFPV
jgi:diacylglycerol kinase (ATP)